MTPDWQILAELAVFLDLDREEDDVAATAFEMLGFPHPAEHYGAGAACALVLELERRREAGGAVREYDGDLFGLMYYEPDAADGDKDMRVQAGHLFVQDVARDISPSFVGL